MYSCHQAKEVKVQRVGFYYWQTTFSFDKEKKQYLDSNHSNLLYVRLFDIDTQQQFNGDVRVAPKSIILVADSFSKHIHYVPVVYITRQAIKHMKSVDTLAENIQQLVKSITLNYHIDYNEIQWDFDWTPSTKDTYFQLLKKLKSLPTFSDKKFSCTIRLHQIKNRNQAGIPPVDKGLLMCYNMGNLKKYGNDNSILDEKIAADYLNNMESYPLKLDVAFSLFSWALLFRNKQFVSILNDVSIEDFADNTDFIKSENGLFKSTKNTYIKQFEIEKNDEIRVETIGKNTLKNVVRFVGQHNNNDSVNLLFFSLKQPEIKKYPTYELQEIINSY